MNAEQIVRSMISEIDKAADADTEKTLAECGDKLKTPEILETVLKRAFIHGVQYAIEQMAGKQ